MNRDGTNSDAHGTAAADAAGVEARAQRVRYQEAFEFSTDAQAITDGRGVVLEGNHAASALLRCPKEFLIGKPLALFAVEGRRARFYEAIGRLFRGAAADSFESQLARRGPSADNVRLHWIIRDITEWKRDEAARADLQQQLTTAQEDERRRVARDLHDTTGQLLTALALSVRAVRDAGPLPEAARQRLDHVQRLTDELARQVHDLATRLRPAALDDLGLSAAARQLAADWSARTGVALDFQAPAAGVPRFPAEVETALYRVVQEALTNVAKHAGARRVAVVIGHSDGYAVVIVEDDGVGFDPELFREALAPDRRTGDRARLGLLGMRERVGLVGGVLEVESAPGLGTTVIARVPVSGQADR